jgi:Tfp pilus assembly protein PilV
MSKISTNEGGFTVTEVLLVILIIAVIGFGGYYVWHIQHKTKATTTTITTTSNTKPTTTTPTAATPAPLSISAVTSLLTTFYNQYISASNSTSTNQATLIKQVVQEYGTSNLVNYAYPSTGSYSEDPIVCAQDIPSSFSVAGVTSTSTSAAGTITEVFGSDTVKVNTTVVSQSGSLKVGTVACNPALTPQEGSP